jgi:hypothetical protein
MALDKAVSSEVDPAVSDDAPASTPPTPEREPEPESAREPESERETEADHTAAGEHLAVVQEVPSPRAGPVGRRADGGLVRARQVERLVRRVRLWSVLRVSLVFYLCVWLMFTVAGLILWRVAVSAGAIDNVESFLADLLVDEPDSFVIDGVSILQASALAGLILVVAGTAITVLLALLFNLISEFTGGIRVAVVELETAELVDPAELDGPDEPRSG